MMRHIRIFVLLSLWIPFFATPSFAITNATVYYVAPNGLASNPGTLEAPFATIAQCTAIAQAGDSCIIRAGIYRERIRPSNSGTLEAPITIEAYPGEEPIVSAFEVLEGTWESVGPNIIRTTLPEGFDQGIGANRVFRDGEMQMEARWPNMPQATRLKRSDYAISSGGAILEDQGNFDYTARYNHPGIADYWAGGYISFSAGYEWWGKHGSVTSSTSGEVNFTFNVGSDWAKTYTIPNADDPFFLWGRLEALDMPNEFFYDTTGEYGAANTLYMYATPDSSQQLIEWQTRQIALDLTDRSYIDIKGLTFFGGRIASNPNSSNLHFDRLDLRYAGTHRMAGGWGAPALDLRGTNHSLTNSKMAHAPSSFLEIRGENHQVRNNVFHDGGYVISVSDGIQTWNTTGTSIEHNTIFDTRSIAISTAGLKAGAVRNNHVYNIGLQTTDTSAINAWNGGDAQGTEIAYNLVHNVVAYYNLNGADPHYGGKGIRLDSGAAPEGNTNYVIHHNVVFNTTSNALALWGVEPNHANYGDSKIYAYHNTLIGGVYLRDGGDFSHAGTVLQNNIIDGILFSNTGTLVPPGATLSNNIMTEQNVAQNEFGPPRYTSPRNHNFSLGATSTAIDTGLVLSPWNDNYAGVGPDIGAYERGRTPFVSGAELLQEHLEQLSVTCTTNECIVENLPMGWHLPSNFTLTVGTQSSADCSTSVEWTTHTYSGMCAIQLTPGNYTVWGQIGSQPQVELGTVSVGILSVDQVTPNQGPLGVQNNVSITGQGFSGSLEWRIPVTLTNAGSKDLSELPVALRIDTASLVSAGKLASDCSDLDLTDITGEVQYSLWIEAGCNTAETLVWVREHPDTPASTIVNLADWSQLYLTRSTNAVHGLEYVWPPLAKSSNQVWLAANDLEAGALAAWPNRNTQGPNISQTQPERQPLVVADQINGFASVQFDGQADMFELGDGLGNERYGAIFSVFYNPEPGATNWQRMYSSVPAEIGNDYQHRGVYFIPPSTSTGVLTPATEPLLHSAAHRSQSWNGNPLEPVDMRNFTIARKNNAEVYYKGAISELIVFNEEISRAEETLVKTYLTRKYKLESDTPELQAEATESIEPLSVYFGTERCEVIEIDAPNKLTCMTPPGITAGPVVVRIEHNENSVELPNGYTYTASYNIFLPTIQR